VLITSVDCEYLAFLAVLRTHRQVLAIAFFAESPLLPYKTHLSPPVFSFLTNNDTTHSITYKFNQQPNVLLNASLPHPYQTKSPLEEGERGENNDLLLLSSHLCRKYSPRSCSSGGSNNLLSHSACWPFYAFASRRSATTWLSRGDGISSDISNLHPSGACG